MPANDEDYWQNLQASDPEQSGAAVHDNNTTEAFLDVGVALPEEAGGQIPSNCLPHAVGEALTPLFSEGYALYAVIDGATVPNLRMTIEASGLDHRSLLQGEKDIELAEVAPILVQLAPPDKLTRAIFARAGVPSPLWDSNSASLFVSNVGIEGLRAHLRRMTMLQTEALTWQYFRFYIPSVLHGLRPMLLDDPQLVRSFSGDAIRAVLYQPPLRNHLAMLKFPAQSRAPAPISTAELREAAARWVPVIQIERHSKDIAEFLQREDMHLCAQFKSLRPSQRFGLTKDLWRMGIRNVVQASAIVSITLMTGVNLLREPAFFYATKNPFLSGHAKARQLITAYQMISAQKERD